MENLQTIVCPNCGAVTSSNKNCEYCGSILSRVASAFYDENNEKANIKDLGFGKTAYVSFKLVSAIEKSIKQSQKHNTDVTCVLGKITLKTRVGGYTDMLQIEFNMNESYDNDRFTAFESSRLGKLFSIHQKGCLMICSLQLDNDTITTAQIVQYILRNVFLKNDSDISVSTWVRLNGEDYMIVSAAEKQAIEEEDKETLELMRYSDNEKREEIESKYKKLFDASYRNYKSEQEKVINKKDSIYTFVGIALFVILFGLLALTITYDGAFDILVYGIGVIFIGVIVMGPVIGKKEQKTLHIDYYKQHLWPIDFEQAKQSEANADWIIYYKDAISPMNYIGESDRFVGESHYCIIE